MSCPTYVNCDRMGYRVLCMYTVRGGVSCPVTIYCDRVGWHVMYLYTVTGWGGMSCACIL